MSYLPRMSKTYKEPQKPDFEEPEEILPLNTIKPASSLLNYKVYNPQSILKHYRYHPHPLPVLPGPSVLEEAIENELYSENNRLRRSATKIQTNLKESEITAEEPVETQQNDNNIFENELITEENIKKSQSRKGLKKSKTNLSKRKSAKHLKRDDSSKITLNMCLIKTDMPLMFNDAGINSKNMYKEGEFFNHNDNTYNKYEKSSTVKSPKTRNIMESSKQKRVEVEFKNSIDSSTQCAIVGSFSKVFVIPPVINSLLCTLSFLLHEISKETIMILAKEKKTVLTQTQSLLDNLCNEKVDKEYSFEMTYSDFKRLEKILGELKKYLKDLYGDKSECIDKMKDLKKIFIELKKKELELFDLGEKLLEVEEGPKEIKVSEKDMKNPEVTLQNNRLECEQLMAEVEFGLMELRSYQNTLAELDWDFKNINKQIQNLKKSATNCKTEIIGRKCTRKFSSEVLLKGMRNLGSEIGNKKKT